MFQKHRRFSVSLLTFCCLVLSLPPLPVSATPTETDPTFTESPPSDSVLLETPALISPKQVIRSELAPEQSQLVKSQTPSITETTSPETVPGEPVPVSFYPGIVITQLQTQSLGSATSELLEIRNNSPDTIDVTKWKIFYGSAGGGAWQLTYEFKASSTDIGYRLLLAPESSLVFISDNFLAENPNFQHSGILLKGMANSGRLLIADSLDAAQSGLAWGEGTVPVEGMPIGAHKKGDLIDRKLLDNGWYQNSRVNKDDFINEGKLREVYQIAALEEVFDACLNLPGIDPNVPVGWNRDNKTGYCSEAPPQSINTCEGVIISEIGANIAQQFIEIHNPTNQAIELEGCRLMTNRSTAKYYQFSKQQLEVGSYLAVEIANSGLTLTKTTSGTVYVLSSDGNSEVDQVSYANLQSGTSWALVDGEWHQTYVVTANLPNRYEQFLPCQAGYERNLDTGRCNKIVLTSGPKPCAANQYRSLETGRCRLRSTTSGLLACREGQYRHPSTNRCRNLVSTTSSLVPCRPGQVRNPATNRCRSSVNTANRLKPCQPGWERNLETNRCRKIRSNASVAGAAFPVETVKDGAEVFTGWWALGGVLTLGLAYAGWEWRNEIGNIVRRIASKSSI